MLKVFNDLFEGGYVSISRALNIFYESIAVDIVSKYLDKKRGDETIEHIFTKQQSLIDKFISLYIPIRDYLRIPSLNMHIDLHNDNCEKCLCRVIYELEVKDYIYNTQLYKEYKKVFIKLRCVMTHLRLAKRIIILSVHYKGGATERVVK